MSLLETLRQRQETTDAESAATRAVAWRHYREILERADTPQEDDADTLAALVDELGLTPAHCELHNIVLAEYAKLQNALDRVPEHRDVLAKSDTRMKDIREQVKALNAELVSLHHERETAEKCIIDEPSVSRDIDMLSHQFPGVLLAEDREVPEELRKHVVSPEVFQAQRRLGLETVGYS